MRLDDVDYVMCTHLPADPVGWLPVAEAGQAQLVGSDFALDEQVWLGPTPGPTPDHLSVRLRSVGDEAVITGDLIHSPVQRRKPGWSYAGDADPEQARRTRRALLAHCCERSTLMCASHFPSPSFGRVLARGDSFDFSYASGA